MKQNVKRWLPIALCCLPGIAVAIAIGASLGAGGAAVAGWYGWSLRALIFLACPLAMGLMMWWMSRDMGHGRSEHNPQSAADQLAALRVQEQALEALVAAEGRAAREVQPAVGARSAVPEPERSR